MAGDIDWGSISLAGSFIVGAFLATLTVLRLLQIVHKIERKNRDED